MTSVVAIGDDPPAPAGKSIETPSQPNAESLHRPPKGDVVIGFDDQMQVIRLNREVHDPSTEPLASAPQDLTNGRVDTKAAQISNATFDPRRDVHRMSRIQPRPPGVRDPPAPPVSPSPAPP